MKLTTSFLLIVAIGVLASCNGYQNVTPLAQQPQTSAPANSLLRSLLPPGINPQSGATCTAPTYKPKAGPFIIFIANGKVKRGTFKSATSPLTLWVAIKIKKATKPTPPPTTPPSGSPSTAPSPTPPPMDQPVYLYLGEYTLAKNKQTGCAYLFTTQNGKPFTGSKFSGLAFGSPSIAYPKYWKEKVIASGPVSVKLSKLSATGGNGKATLKMQNGTTYDTATVHLTYRLSEP
jgi:hypothetical protein